MISAFDVPAAPPLVRKNAGAVARPYCKRLWPLFRTAWSAKDDRSGRVGGARKCVGHLILPIAVNGIDDDRIGHFVTSQTLRLIVERIPVASHN
jgi:hypothetical protein